jgi:hypothetical protein
MELRMYGLTPYNISPIQQAIQFGHAVVEYGLDHFNSPLYQEWAKKWKTFVILNGGTTNMNIESPGSLNLHLEKLRSNGINCGTFHEPDLGDQLTAVVFIVDERVFNKKLYPDFDVYAKGKLPMKSWIVYFRSDYPPPFSDEMHGLYEEWKQGVGGDSIVFMREFLKPFRKA